MASQIHFTKICDLNPDKNEDLITFDARVHRILDPEPQYPWVVLLRDDGYFVTAVLNEKQSETIAKVLKAQLSIETLVRVSGSIETSDKEITPMRILLFDLDVLSKAKENLMPKTSNGTSGDSSILNKVRNSSFDERLANRVLDARSPETGAIFKLFSGVYALAIEYLMTRKFHWIPTPKLIDYKVPGDDDYFQVPYMNGQHAWLTQTGEVHLVMALSADLERVFDVHTVFRREKDISTRHLTEFTTLEVGFVLKHGWEEILQFAEEIIIFIVHSLQEKYTSLLSVASEKYPRADKFKLGLDKDSHFIRVTFSKAKDILKQTLGLDTEKHVDFTREEEAALGSYFASTESEFGPPTDLFVITHYPSHIRPFNYYPTDGDPSTTNSFDIIIRGQEACTGLHLIHDYEKLRLLMKARNPPMNPDSPTWEPFVSAHEAGLPPMGGFGMGLNRFVQGFLGLSDIHETVLFPRDASRLRP